MFEAEVTGRLEHPGIVPVYGLGKDDQGNPFYVRRFVRGQSLEEAIRHYHRSDAGSPRNARSRTLELRSLLDRFTDVCHAIAYAHSRGVLHRDLKPANIMLGPFNESLVVDCGLAKKFDRSAVHARAATPTALEADPQSRDAHDPDAAEDEATAHDQRAGADHAAPIGFSSSTDTQAGTALGTPAFMSPEQAEGRIDELGPSSDVYSLGAVLYTLLCGKTPFEYVWCDVTALIDRVKIGEFPRPRTINIQIPRKLEAVCMKAMEMRPEDRYATATDLAQEIKRWLSDEPIACYREPLPARMTRWGRRHKPIVTGAAALLLTALAALTGGLVLLGREQRKTETQRLAAVHQSSLVSEKAESLRRGDAVSRVNLAYREYLDDNVARADQLLNDCPADLQEWEWEYARLLGHSELKTLAGSSQGQDVWAVAFSPDGSLIACGSGPWSYVGNGPTGELLVRSVQTGTEVFGLRGLTGAVQALAFSPDGRQLAAAWRFSGNDNGARLAIFDIPGGRKVWEKPEQGLQILSLAFSPDGRTVATGGWDKTIRTWDRATGAHLQSLIGHRGFVRGLAFSADGTQLVSGSEDKSVRRWDLAGGGENAAFHGHTGFVHCVAFGPDGALAASGSQDGTVKLWPAAAPDIQVTFRNSAGWVGTLAIAPLGRLVASAHNGNIRIWDPRTGEELQRLTSPRNMMGDIALAFAPDGATLAASGHSTSINLWDTAFLEPSRAPSARTRLRVPKSDPFSVSLYAAATSV